MDFLLYGTLGAVGVVGVFGYKMFATYNRLMALDERCNTAYADIDVLMKHRHTLLQGNRMSFIPELSGTENPRPKQPSVVLA